MKKILLLAAMVTILTGTLVAADMTADELISKYFAASGGETNFRAVKTMFIKGSMFAQGMTMDVKVWTILPSKSYLDMSMNGMSLQKVGTNGTDAWTSNMAGTFLLDEEGKKTAANQANMFPLLDYKKSGAKVKMLGEDLVKGAKALKLEYVSAKNDTTIYYFDAATFMPVKEKRGEGTETMSDYRKIGGISMPFKMNIQSAQGQMMMTLDSIAVNPSVPDSLFTVPKDAKPFEELKKLQEQMMQQRQGQGQGQGQGK